VAEDKESVMGRPKSLDTVDLEQVALFGRFRATYETMAGHFGVSTRTVERYMTDDESDFCRCYKKAFSECKMSIAEAQVRSALDGNATLLIWLGKQHLGQVDKSEVKQEVEVKTITINRVSKTISEDV